MINKLDKDQNNFEEGTFVNGNNDQVVLINKIKGVFDCKKKIRRAKEGRKSVKRDKQKENKVDLNFLLQG